MRYTVDTVKEAEFRDEYGNCSYGLHNCLGYAQKWKSGAAICYPCWEDVKLNLPAARHWAPAAMHFLCNIDIYDKMTYLKACGLTQEEMVTMLNAVDKVLTHSDALIFDIPIDQLDRPAQIERRTDYLKKNGS